MCSYSTNQCGSIKLSMCVTTPTSCRRPQLSICGFGRTQIQQGVTMRFFRIRCQKRIMEKLLRERVLNPIPSQSAQYASLLILEFEHISNCPSVSSTKHGHVLVRNKVVFKECGIGFDKKWDQIRTSVGKCVGVGYLQVCVEIMYAKLQGPKFFIGWSGFNAYPNQHSKILHNKFILIMRLSITLSSNSHVGSRTSTNKI